MNIYNIRVKRELHQWQAAMQRKPTYFNRLSKRLQTKINSIIPEKVHEAITAAIKQMIKAVLFGAGATTDKPHQIKSLELTEAVMLESIDTYKKTAAAEGGITGAGGILMSFADFPLLIGIKIKMLFDIATRYGYDVTDYKERIYLLHIFQLAFSSHEHRRTVYLQMTDWKKTKVDLLPDDINQFEWRSFQQEYRDYIDLAKLAQMIPVIGAAVGLVVNYRLIKKLGETAMNAYRMRLADENLI
ncbi:MAG: EcsC family protein [Chitinophagaceae bacterium]|nr:MAG: EcsC family protein [Chitinophagaceae bacterium]